MSKESYEKNHRLPQTLDPHKEPYEGPYHPHRPIKKNSAMDTIGMILVPVLLIALVAFLPEYPSSARNTRPEPSGGLVGVSTNEPKVIVDMEKEQAHIILQVEPRE